MATELKEFNHKAFLKPLTTRPGVYRMFDGEGKILYVGKAGDLKKRLGSYFRKTGLNIKTQRLVEQIANIEVTVTRTEAEALLLESNLIKQHRPCYNILLRDDKSYPYIYLSSQHDYPRLCLHRGARRNKGQYFGPFPNATSVRDSLHLLQKLFKVRQCEDSFFANRSRPCLQYQIKRCAAPCVGLVDEQHYAADVKRTVLFLEGHSNEVIDGLVSEMESAASSQDYEQAAVCRDLIASLGRVQDKQYISNQGRDVDVVACLAEKGSACVQVFYIRGGRNLGNVVFFPKMPLQASAAEVLAAFLPQYYLGKDVPAEVLLSHELKDTGLIADVLGQHAGHRVQLRSNVRGKRAQWIKMALSNAELALTTYINTRQGFSMRMQSLTTALSLDETPERIECFDISHTAGESTVASCVVFGLEGPLKADYRRFNITDIQPGDDYAAMEQALTRRYTRLKKGEGKLPDILLIDGGKGQVSSACKALEELQVTDVRIIGVAKGPGRKPGLETLHIPGRTDAVVLTADSPALHLIQQVRDEAHRFAITGHRQRRARTRNTSPLEQIAGVGPKRRQQLLKQMGGLREVARAGVDELTRIKGINRHLAQQIYDAFHGE